MVERYVKVGQKCAFRNYQMFCTAIPRLLCRAKDAGLVRYPTALAPLTSSVIVTTQCADNAHGVSSSLNVLCTSSGSWSGATPQCQCDTVYRSKTVRGRQICQGLCSSFIHSFMYIQFCVQKLLSCEAKSEGLVHYPTTLAPVSGSVTVTTECADNAHITHTSLVQLKW